MSVIEARGMKYRREKYSAYNNLSYGRRYNKLSDAIQLIACYGLIQTKKIKRVQDFIQISLFGVE